MARTFKIDDLDLAQQMQVDQCIRIYRYMHLDRILHMIQELKIEGVSRSALHRYLLKLKAKDQLHAQPDEGTIITIVERGTGEVRIVKSTASGLAIASLIEKMKAPPVIS
jgi:hypothetical protein